MGTDLVRTSGEVALEIPPLAEYVGTGRMVVASLARHYGFSDEQVEDLKVAVSEAITNAMRAHVDAGRDDPVHVGVSMDGDALTVVVSDRGSGIASDDELDLGMTPVPGGMEGGLGLTLIRTLVPETSIETRSDGGTTLSMTLKREGTS